MSNRLRWLNAALILTTPLAAGAQTEHVPSVAEALGRPLVRAAVIAPAGNAVAYLQRETHWRDNEFVWQLWLAGTGSGSGSGDDAGKISGAAPVQLTRGRKSVSQAEWSPDGGWLAFIAERESNAAESAPPAAGGDPATPPKTAAKQVWMISPRGGEAWQLTESPRNVEEFHWNKDGRAITFAAEAPESSADKAREERYAGYRVVERDFQQKQLWRVNAADAEKEFRPVRATQITFDASLNVAGFAMSPRGDALVFSASRNPLLADRKDTDLYLLESGKPTRIVGIEGPDTLPLFSGDAKEVAFLSTLAQPNYFYANAHILKIDLAAATARAVTVPRQAVDLTAAFDESPLPMAWTPRGLFFLAAQKMTTRVFRLAPDTGRIAAATPAAMIVDDASVSADGSTLAFVAEDATHTTEVYVAAADSTPRRLTNLTAQLEHWQLGSVEVVTWTSKDGATIEGVLHKPADYDPARKYPLLVKIHGGPTAASQPKYLAEDYAYPVPNFLAKGALILEPNYRGSGGYGAAFRALNVRNLGVGDMWDVMSGVDALIHKGLVDPGKMAAMGWSQGGYISAYLTTHTDRFRAISVGAGISDWMTYYVSTDITPFTPQYLHATPWDDPRIYALTSPISGIRNARTPTLIQHGSADQRVPAADAYELYRGLKDQGVATRLITYTGFGHNIDKPKSRLALALANFDWFAHYVWGDPIPRDSALLGTSELEPDPAPT